MKNQQTNQSSSRALSFDKRLTLKQQRFVDAYIQIGSVQGKKEQPSLLAFLRTLLKSLEQGLKRQIC